MPAERTSWRLAGPPGGGLSGFAGVGGAHLRKGEVGALEELEDDRALEERVVGKVDDAAAACADLADELVLLYLAALHGSLLQGPRGGWFRVHYFSGPGSCRNSRYCSSGGGHCFAPRGGG